MAKFKVSYVYKRMGSTGGGCQASKIVQAPSANTAVSIVKSEMQAKGNLFELKGVQEMK